MHEQRQAVSYPGGMLLHLVLVAVRATGMATPKAVLAELIVVALLASVAEAHHALAVTVGALHRMEDWRPAKEGAENNTVSAEDRTIWRKTKPTVTAKVETDRPKPLNCLTSDTAFLRITRVLARVRTQNPSHHLIQLQHQYSQHF